MEIKNIFGGAIFFFIGLGYLWAQGAFLHISNAHKCVGRVIQLEQATSSRRSSCRAVVSFSGVDGQTHIMRSQYSAPGFSVGRKVKVLYNSEDYTQAYIQPSWLRWIFGIILMGIGGWIVATTLLPFCLK